MEFENEHQRKDPEEILRKMETTALGDCNETNERYVFNRRDQVTKETVTALCHSTEKIGKDLNYGALTDSLILDGKLEISTGW